MIELNHRVTQEVFGDMVGVSQQSVSEMLSKGVITEGQTAGQWLRLYCGHLREKAAGRAASGDLDLASERARLAKEQADRVAMQNAVSRRELAPVALIEEVIAKSASRVAGIFDAIPGLLRRRFPHLSYEEIKLITEEITKVRNVVGSMSLDDLDDQGMPDEQA